MVSPKDNASAITAVAAVGTSVGVILHVAKVHTSPSALSRAAINLDVVDKIRFFHSIILKAISKKSVTAILQTINHLRDICEDAVKVA